MEEIASQFYEELQEIVDRYKNFMSVPRIMHVAQDVFHKTLSVRYNPELCPEEMAEKYAKTNRHYVIAKRENGADYAKEVSSVTIEQAYLAGFESCNQQLVRAKEIIRDLLKCLPKENIEGIYETIEAAEDFLRDGESKCIG